MPRHLFRVHSPITYFMAMRVIALEKIPVQDVILLTSRSFVPFDDFYPTATIQFATYPNDSFTVDFAFWKSWPKIKSFDSWIMTITQDNPFYFYADHAYSSFFNLIVTYPLCKGYYYIEEGLVAYRPTKLWQIKKPYNPFRKLLYWLNFGLRNNPNRSYFTTDIGHYLGCFGVHEESYKTLPNKKNVGFPFPEAKFEEKYECLIVHDNIYDRFAPAVYLKWIEVIINDALGRGIAKFHQKFHPSQAENTVKEIKSFMEKVLEGKAVIITLDNSVALEQIAVSQKPLVYVCLSSVGMYAYLVGCEVISIHRMCSKEDPFFRDLEKFYPSFYLENITYLT